MKDSFVLLRSLLLGLGAGFLMAWPSAHRWDVLLPYQRLSDAALHFGIAAALSLGLFQAAGRPTPQIDALRAFSLLLGAALCFCIVRQEITLLVYGALWAVPGTFLGAAVGKWWLERRAEAVAFDAPPMAREREEQLCSR